MNAPPTLRVLLTDPVFRQYMKTVPRNHRLLADGQPWQVWVLTTTGTWRTGLFSTYNDAWSLAVRQIKDTAAVADVAITSRRVLFAPPTGFETALPWCPRCRRPVIWRVLNPRHHALKHLPVVPDPDDARCTFCGIREAGCGRPSQWTVLR